MTDLDRARRALHMAAIQADHWPARHGLHWGRTLDGLWADDPSETAEYG